MNCNITGCSIIKLKIKNAIENSFILCSSSISPNNNKINVTITAEINDETDSMIEQKAIFLEETLYFLYETNNIPYNKARPGTYFPSSE